MSIIGSAKYLITHQDKDNDESHYVGTFDKLRSTIATTWSKIPHRVVVEGFTVKVLNQTKLTEELEAVFIFSPLSSQELPDNLFLEM